MTTLSHIDESNSIGVLNVAYRGGRRKRRVLRGAERREIQAVITTWTFTPQPFREPRTLRELAKVLHISYSYVKYIKRKISSSLDAFTDECEGLVVAQYREICRALADRAKAGDVAAIKWVIREIIQ